MSSNTATEKPSKVAKTATTTVYTHDITWSENSEDAPLYDWKIDINVENKPELRKVYYVHKTFLVHHSGYFVALFTNPFKEKSEDTSKIDLTEKEAQNFVHILDYCYGKFEWTGDKIFPVMPLALW